MRRLRPTFVSALFLTLVLAGVVAAQAPRLPATLAGSWESTVGPEEARRRAMAAFRPRLERFPSFIRGMAERRIEERIELVRQVDIEFEGERVRVVTVGRRRQVVDTTLGGATRVEGADGESRRVTQRLRGGWLEQVVEGESGSVRRLLSTEPDGQTLHVDVTVSNERLGEPVRWRIDYRRR